MKIIAEVRATKAHSAGPALSGGVACAMKFMDFSLKLVFV